MALEEDMANWHVWRRMFCGQGSNTNLAPSHSILHLLAHAGHPTPAASTLQLRCHLKDNVPSSIWRFNLVQSENRQWK